MHVEALLWSNLSGRVYAEAHRLSVERLYHWRELIANGAVEVDWRSMLHPSARPSISTSMRPTQAKSTQRYAHLFDDPVRQGVDGVGNMLRPKLRLVSDEPVPDRVA